jgi:uncharacterized membrane protein
MDVVPFSFFKPDDTWALWTFLIVAAYVCILLEHKYKWASQISGAVLALIIGLVAANLRIIPIDAPVWDAVWNFILPLSVTMLLFSADLRRILKESGRMFGIFNISAVTTVIGAFVAVILYHNFIPEFNKAAGMMTGSYIGGGVNFVALSKAFEASGTLVSTLTVADNLNMALAFLLLLAIPNFRFIKRIFKHPYEDEIQELAKASVEAEQETRAAAYWKRKEISLLDIASIIAIAFFIVFIAGKFSGWVQSVIPADATGFMSLVRIVFGQLYLVIPVVTIGLATLFPKWLPKIPGAYEVGMFGVYLFFVVIGIPASIYTIITKAPILLAFCFTIAAINIVLTLIGGKVFHYSVEECVISSNANLGGPSTAAGMAIAKGWTKLVTPAILVGVWGYAIGNYVGMFVGLTVLSMFHH